MSASELPSIEEAVKAHETAKSRVESAEESLRKARAKLEDLNEDSKQALLEAGEDLDLSADYENARKAVVEQRAVVRMVEEGLKERKVTLDHSQVALAIARKVYVKKGLNPDLPSKEDRQQWLKNSVKRIESVLIEEYREAMRLDMQHSYVTGKIEEARKGGFQIPGVEVRGVNQWGQVSMWAINGEDFRGPGVTALDSEVERLNRSVRSDATLRRSKPSES